MCVLQVHTAVARVETGSVLNWGPGCQTVCQVWNQISDTWIPFTPNTTYCSKVQLCVCPACGRMSRALPPQVKRVVGGRSAGPGLFPWQVLLSVEDLSRVPESRWFGSGALLSEFWVLTAAHVLRSQRRDTSVVPVAPEHVKVWTGSSYTPLC